MTEPPVAWPHCPAGIAFEIGELLLLRAWAEWSGLGMAVALDHTDGAGEYEEVVRLYARGAGLPQLTFWRTVGAIMVVSTFGVPKPFGSISAALEACGAPADKGAQPRPDL